MNERADEPTTWADAAELDQQLHQQPTRANQEQHQSHDTPGSWADASKQDGQR